MKPRRSQDVPFSQPWFWEGGGAKFSINFVQDYIIILDRRKSNGKPSSHRPPPPKSRMKPRESQNEPFSFPWLGGGGEGLNLSKIVGLHVIRWHTCVISRHKAVTNISSLGKRPTSCEASTSLTRLTRCQCILRGFSIVGFHMTSLKFKLQNYRSYGDFTFMVY